MGNRRRKKSKQYEVLIIPQGDGGTTRSFKGSFLKLGLAGGALAAVFFLLYLMAFRYTPFGRLVGLDPEQMEARRKTEAETERRIAALADELEILKDYNATLRKALGENTSINASQQAPPQRQLRAEEPAPQQSVREEAVTTSAPLQPVTNFSGLRFALPLFSPVSAAVSRGFEPDAAHYGVDFAAPVGSSVSAAADGYVVFAGWTYDEGNTIILSHGSGIVTAYKHNSALLKNTGASVQRGEPIALVGSTGRTSTGPHLHFEVLRDGVPQNPVPLLLNLKTSL